jgi:hypothetical protein
MHYFDFKIKINLYFLPNLATTNHWEKNLKENNNLVEFEIYTLFLQNLAINSINTPRKHKCQKNQQN